MDLTSIAINKDELRAFDILCRKFNISRSVAVRAFIRASLKNVAILEAVLQYRDYPIIGRPRKEV